MPSTAKIPKPIEHTQRAYASLNDAYKFFNKSLFNSTLPNCLITYQRHSKAYGYFSPKRFQSVEANTVAVDEIAMNPQYFQKRDENKILSTLVHEMVHLWQFKFGKPSRNGYHNTEWAMEMIRVGLQPTDTGLAGGKIVGQNMTHIITPSGDFDFLCVKYLAKHKLHLYADNTTKAKAKTYNSKTKFTCESCEAAAWGKPELNIICAICNEPMCKA